MNHHNLAESAEDPALTTREVARLLGVAVSTAQLWIESGALPSWKTPGGHRRVRHSAVLQLLASQKNKPLADEEPTPKSNAETNPEYVAPAAADYPLPDNEGERLAALAATNLVDTPPEQLFDRLTWLATRITQAPIALVSLLTSQRQWFKSRVGIDVADTPRDWAFCSHAIVNESILIVEDALNDLRFRTNPLVTGEPHIRFYAGAPITAKNNLRLGTLCVIDRQPRQLNEEQIRALRELAAIASEEIARRG